MAKKKGRLIHWAKEYNVNPRDLQPVMRRALLIVDGVYERINRTLTVTCTGGGDHSSTSLHPWGYAFDVRTRNMSITQQRKALQEIEALFKGTGYQITFHTTHFHIEYDPKDWKDTF